MRKFSKLEQTRVERALALLKKYTRGKCLMNVTKYSIVPKIVFPADESAPTITWSPCNGLHRFLHELGHFHVSRGRARAFNRGKRESVADELLDEAKAWAWAERTAKREHIEFNYASAERDYHCYTRNAPLKIKWRYR